LYSGSEQSEYGPTGVLTEVLRGFGEAWGRTSNKVTTTSKSLTAHSMSPHGI